MKKPRRVKLGRKIAKSSVAATILVVETAVVSAASVEVPVLPSVVERTQAAYKADGHALGPISQTLHGYNLTPAQLISVRNYIGQYDEKLKVVSIGKVNGVDLFVIKNRTTGEFFGEVELRPGSNGELIVDKTTGAELDVRKKVEVPLVLPSEDGEAGKILSGSDVLNVLHSKHHKNESSQEMPFASAEAGVDYGTAREATGHFMPDGSGYEYGMVSKIGSAGAEAKAGVSDKGEIGGSIGGGAKGPEVELFANYFGKPDVDEDGKFTRTVMGGSGNLHATLAEVEAKLGCFDDKPCKVELGAGALGIGSGVGLAYSEHVAIQVKPSNEIEDEGIAAPAKPAPDTSDAVETEYRQAISSDDPAALEAFVETHPDSLFTQDAENLLDIQVRPDPEAQIPPGGY
ncbi:hypothetical protein ACVDG8_003545 [Mesorhizobium sp. ORM8.1]